MHSSQTFYGDFRGTNPYVQCVKVAPVRKNNVILLLRILDRVTVIESHSQNIRRHNDAITEMEKRMKVSNSHTALHLSLLYITHLPVLTKLLLVVNTLVQTLMELPWQ